VKTRISLRRRSGISPRKRAVPTKVS
jgi:hypothetical protein